MTQRFLSFLFGGYPIGANLTCEIRAIEPETHEVVQRWFGLEEQYLARAAAYCHELAPTHDVFVGVLPRTGRGGYARDVNHARMLFCDVDAGNDRAGVFDLLFRSGLLEHIGALVETPSGGGHIYWRLSDTLTLSDAETRQGYRDLLKRVVRAIGGEKPGPHADGNAAEEARVLRVPGTLYHKTDAPTPIARWFLAHTEPQPASWWNRTLPVAPPPAERKPFTPRSQTALPHAGRDFRDDEQLLTAALSKPVFSALWLGDTSRYGGDESRADMALMASLAWWTDRDPSRMERLFGRSMLGQRDKWQREDYRKRTIEHALGGATG